MNKRFGPVFKYGLATGFALILLGGISLYLSLTTAFLEILVVCVGLGVILGAFGSTASISIPIQGISLGGVGAIVVALFIIMLAQLDDRYVLVKVGGDLEDASVELVGDNNYFGAYRKTLRTHDFIIFGRELKRSKLSLYITLQNQREYPFECIDSGVLRHDLATGNTIEWSFKLPDPDDESDTPSIYDEEGQPIAEDVGGCRTRTSHVLDGSSSDEKSLFGLVFGIFSSAFAQPNRASSGPEIQTDVKRLESDTSHVRRGARSELAAEGVAVVEPLLEGLSEDPLSYRLRLGIIVALTEMLRENKQNRTEIIELIKEEDLVRLVDAAADEDRTTRIYASEFLYDLGDPRSISVAFDRIPSASVNSRYNLLLGIKGAVPFASNDEQAEVIEKVTALKSAETPDTNDLIDSIVDLANRN
jgi:hypothetical protein